jgi:hypothetical protein
MGAFLRRLWFSGYFSSFHFSAVTDERPASSASELIHKEFCFRGVISGAFTIADSICDIAEKRDK